MKLCSLILDILSLTSIPTHKDLLYFTGLIKFMSLQLWKIWTYMKHHISSSLRLFKLHFIPWWIPFSSLIIKNCSSLVRNQQPLKNIEKDLIITLIQKYFEIRNCTSLWIEINFHNTLTNGIKLDLKTLCLSLFSMQISLVIFLSMFSRSWGSYYFKHDTVMKNFRNLFRDIFLLAYRTFVRSQFRSVQFFDFKQTVLPITSFANFRYVTFHRKRST